MKTKFVLSNRSFSHAIQTRRGPLILLFYDGYEWRLERGAFARLKAQLHRFARFTYRTLRGKQVRTGFYSQFINLCAALTAAGCDVRVNNYALALKNPHYPIGVSGYPTVIAKLPLTNPAIFGPGDFGMPDTFASIACKSQFGSLICFCEWIGKIYEATCPGKITKWFAGIEPKNWQLGGTGAKDIDCLIYDKIRWDRERLVPILIDDLCKTICSRGLSFEIIRYGEHAQSEYRKLLARSRSLVFLCEHETQGLAYQEALAANIPVFAWDEGVLMDPALRRFAPADLKVSSVPYFSDECGVRFKISTLHDDFDRFLGGLELYRPRNFVEANLSPNESARRYLEAYFSLGVSESNSLTKRVSR